MGGLEKNFDANIVRHGDTEYEEGDKSVSVEEAEDLTEEGIKQIKNTAESIAEDIGDEEVRVWSSPTARTLHSAKIIAEVLQNKGKNLKLEPGGDEYGVRPFEQFGEVENLDFDLFEPLIEGGKVEYKGQEFYIDKTKSNPEDLGYPKYFIEDAVHKIPEKVKAQWPDEYVERIESFEKFNEVTNRLMKNLERASNARDKDYRVIIVTHDALTMFLASSFTDGSKQGLNRSEYISLSREGDDLDVKDISGSAE
jgi:broad specificity phosphatase PhoE